MGRSSRCFISFGNFLGSLAVGWVEKHNNEDVFSNTFHTSISEMLADDTLGNPFVAHLSLLCSGVEVK